MRKFNVYVNGQPFEVLVEEVGGQVSSFPSAVVKPQVTAQTRAAAPAPPKERPMPKPKPRQDVKVEGGAPVTAPMPGSVLDVKVKVGDSVNEGDILLILEAMKMENEVTAPASGKIKSIDVEKGSTVNTGDLMLIIE